MIRMAHVDAEDIGSRLKQLPQHRLLGGGWANGGENLDLAAASH
jgi:hypothetical protein